MSTIFRCIKCSYAVHGDRRPPWPCPCKGKYEQMEVMDHLPAPVPPHVHVIQDPRLGAACIWYRSWHGDFAWEAGSEIQWMVRIPPPDQPEFVDFIGMGRKFKGIEAGHCVSCPTCRAKAGVQCTRPSEHQAFGKWTHADRRNKADAVFFWQHGAGARFERNAAGVLSIVPGEHHEAERVRLQALWRQWEQKGVQQARALHERTKLSLKLMDREETSGQFDLFV